MKILVPPGIGDGYWVLVKLRGFLESRGIEMPEIWIHDSAPRRADDMWSRVPFVKFGGFASFPAAPKPAARRNQRRPRWAVEVSPSDRAFDRAYRAAGSAVQEGVPSGFDYFLSFNGDLAGGRSLDEAMPGVPVNWYEPMTRSKAERAKAAAYQARFGRYVVTAFWDVGFYKKFLADFGVGQIVKLLQAVADAGYTVVMSGAAWDGTGIGARIVAADSRFQSLIGETTFADLAALLEGASGVLGFPAGSTLLGPYFRTPTVLLWNKYFAPGMWTNSVPPDAAYRAVDTRGADPRGVAKLLLEIMATTRRQHV